MVAVNEVATTAFPNNPRTKSDDLMMRPTNKFVKKEEAFDLNEFLDIPALMSDNESDDEYSVVGSVADSVESPTRPVRVLAPAAANVQRQPAIKATSSLTAEQFKAEKIQLMRLIVKYISMKINNLFPPNSLQEKIPLENFLLVLISRLEVSLPVFLKMVIYLFRYMDIIYLLRYLNQSNNFANYASMDFPLKKLIVGCFKLTLMRERVQKDWSSITGMSNNEINVVVKTVMKRLNNKLHIKNIEMVKLRAEVLRYINMVSKKSV